MNAHEHTDPHGDGLTVTHDDGKMWITCTAAHAEVTVGPLAPGILTDYDMDGGVAAALIEKEAEQHDAAEARPLTPDAITDEMVERAHDYWERNSIISSEGMRGLLAAALTEPPARDPRAVALDADMRAWDSEDDFPDQWLDGLADHLARLGWTKEPS